MSTIKIFKYLWWVHKHRWQVFKECVRLGIPWRGLLHDLSDLSRAEFISNMIALFGGREVSQREYDFAWLHHINLNDHHWQWWVMKNEYGQKTVKMSDGAMREMLAEMYLTAKKSNVTVYQWYQRNKNTMILHRETRQELERLIAKYYES